MRRRIQARIAGRVQGVGFRYYTRQVAVQLGVVGSVRNLPGGEVEAIGEGEDTALQAFVDALWQGPHGARVDDVTTAWSEPSGSFKRFDVVA
jgi:acylphosphatase